MATTNETKAPKKVIINIPLSRAEKEDVYVCINGKSYLIKRGKDVEVPASVAEVLKNREDMLVESMEFEAQASANSEQ